MLIARKLLFSGGSCTWNTQGPGPIFSIEKERKNEDKLSNVGLTLYVHWTTWPKPFLVTPGTLSPAVRMCVD